MPYERTIEISLSADARVVVDLSGRPIDRYAVVLLVRVEGGWTEARVYDNHLGSHHVHRYTRSSGKQEPAPFHPGPVNQAIPAAIEHLKQHWEAIIQSWHS